MKISKYLSSALLCSVALFGLTTLSVSANGSNENPSGQGNSYAVTREVPQNNNDQINYADQKGAHRIYQPKYGFIKDLNNGHSHYLKGWYNKNVKYSQKATTQNGTYVKTPHGWLNTDAFNQFVITHGPLNYKMQVIHNAKLYNQPAHTTGVQVLATTQQLGLYHHWIKVNAHADTNLIKGYYRFNYNNQQYWIPGQDVMFNLKALRGHNRAVERVIATGEKLINHSPYDYNTTRRHYDCSAFIHHILAANGHSISSSIYYQAQTGRHVNFHHMKRGDIFFIQARGQGYLAHVAMYLGDGLFMHDSPSSDNGGVDVSSLHDKVWNCNNKYRAVKPNGIARRDRKSVV